MLSYAVGLVIVAGFVWDQLLRKGSDFCRSTRKPCQKQREMKRKEHAEK